MQCGAINGADARVCCCCDARLSGKTSGDTLVRQGLTAAGASGGISAEAATDSVAHAPSGAFNENGPAAPPPASAPLPQPVPSEDADDSESDSNDDRDPRPPWRRELAYRLDIYKARRQHLCAGNSRQPALPVEKSAGRGNGSASHRATANARTRAGETFFPITQSGPATNKNSAPSDVTKNTSRPATNKTPGRVAKDPVAKETNGPFTLNLTEQRPSRPAPAAGAHAPSQSKDAQPAVSNQAAKPSSPPPRTRLPWQDHLEIDVAQPSLNFTGARYYPSDFPVPTNENYSWSDTPRSPAAPLANRALAGMIDAALLIFFYGGFLALFWALGGRFSASKLGAAITAATFGLLYAQYFLLFSLFGGATPGMMARGLRVATFDGGNPASAQLLWRGFGYIASAAVALLGFAWAIWDQDHLTWHDRISQTYLVPR